MELEFSEVLVTTTNSQVPAIISFQIGNKIFIEKNDKFILSFDRYKGVSPYRAKNDREKMVDTINKNDIRR